MRARVGTLVGILLVAGAATALASTQSATKTLTEEHDSVAAKCPSGERVVLGGMQAEFTFDAYSYIESLTRPSSRALKAASYVPSSEAPDLTAIATCARGPKSKEEAEKVKVADGVETSVTAKCPDGKRIVFGGFRGDLDGFEQYVTVIAARATSDGRQWKVTGLNDGTDAKGTLTSLAYCGNAPEVKERTATEVLEAYPDSGTAQATCKPSEKLAFGGFDVNVPGTLEEYVYVIGLEREGDSWNVTATNDGAPAGSEVTSYAYCSKD